MRQLKQLPNLQLLKLIVAAEGAFEVAEPHLLSAGKRDSARILAQMFIDWSEEGGAPGLFALRGTLP